MTDPSQSAVPVAPLVSDLYRRSEAAGYGLTEAEFGTILGEVRAKYLGLAASDSETAKLFESLRIQELALARACAQGNEKAWEVFLTRYRAKLYEMAASIAREESCARELADSLYAELYGLHSREGRRVSKLSYYMGRGSLEGWLRTVLAQGFVDRYRSGKRLVSLEEQEEQGSQFASATPDPVVPADPRLEQAADRALAALPAEEKFILAAYYLDGRTLAEIARMLRVHESTISRKVDRLTRGLRATIIKGLIARGLDPQAAEEALDTDVRDLTVNVSLSLAQGAAGSAFNNKKQ